MPRTGSTGGTGCRGWEAPDAADATHRPDKEKRGSACAREGAGMKKAEMKEAGMKKAGMKKAGMKKTEMKKAGMKEYEYSEGAASDSLRSAGEVQRKKCGKQTGRAGRRRKCAIWCLTFLALIAMIVVLGGCAGGENESVSGENADGGQLSEEAGGSLENLTDDVVVSSEDIRALQELSGKDNSQDAYSAVRKFLLLPEAEDDWEESFCFAAIGENTAVCYRSCRREVLFSEDGEALMEREELGFLLPDGEVKTMETAQRDPFYDLGAVAGEDTYLTYRRTEGVSYVCRLDTDGKTEAEIEISCVGRGECPYQLAMDGDGRLHLLIWTGLDADYAYCAVAGDAWKYCVLSADGELLAACSGMGSTGKLQLLYDGRVALKSERQGRKVLECMDVGTGELCPGFDCPAERMESCYDFTIMKTEDEKAQAATLVYAGARGIYRLSRGEEEAEPLYLWMNHGLTVQEVKGIRAYADGRIGIIYRSKKGIGYLCIAPTTEEVEIREITISVPSYRENVYRSAVVEFNRRYPACHISMKSYDTESLLTELTAGKGPVLVDTALTGFEEMQKLWEPLEKTLSEMGVMENLIGKVMDQGRIDGTLYGVVTDFYLETVAIADQELTDWNYEQFLELAAEYTEPKAVVNTTGNGGWGFLLDFFIQDMEDNFLFDAKAAETFFDTDNFRTILRLAKECEERKERVKQMEGLAEGKVLCNIFTILNAGEIEQYRLAGEGLYRIGFPTKDGAKQILVSSAPVAMRRSASKEEKALAYAFLEILLSEEQQTEAEESQSFHMSVRKDVLAEAIEHPKEENRTRYVELMPYIDEEQADPQKDRALLEQLLENAKPKKGFPKELYNIITEELIPYLEGAVTEDVVIRNLTNRVGLYLLEHAD